MIDIVKYASLIKPSTGQTVLIDKNYNTSAIVKVILKENERAYLDVFDFAKAISKHASSTYELGYMLWSFLKKHITYKEDGMKFQAIKSPSKLWADKSGDCKSYSIFIAAVFKALNRPYTIRFVSYNAFPEVLTHVYTIAHIGHTNIIVDPVWTGKYNTEKNFNFKKDYYMKPGLYSMGSVDPKERDLKTARRKGILQLPKDINSDAGIEIAIIRQRLEIERDILNDHKKIGKVDEYDRSLDVLDELMAAVDNNDHEALDSLISGIGWSFKGAWNSVKKWGHKVATNIKQGVKTLTKVYTAPAKYLARKVLELGLPAVAPMFLYLFISPQLLRRVPPAVRSKRRKQTRVANFFVHTLGFKRNLLMGILRNGIMKKYRKSPEAVLAAQFKGIAGIGFAITIAALIPVIIKLIKKVAGFFGKNGKVIADVAQAMVPDSDDVSHNNHRNFHHGRPPHPHQYRRDHQAVAQQLLRKDTRTAPGTTMREFNIPQDGGKTGPKGWCS